MSGIPRQNDQVPSASGSLAALGMTLGAPLVTLAWGAPLALATFTNNDNPAIWVLTAPFALGVLAYPGYAAAVLRPRNTLWIRISLVLGLAAAIGGLVLAAWMYRHLADPHALGVAIAQSWPTAIATIVCPLIAIAACVRVRRAAAAAPDGPSPRTAR